MSFLFCGNMEKIPETGSDSAQCPCNSPDHVTPRHGFSVNARGPGLRTLIQPTVCLIIIGSGNYLIIGTSAILINSKAEPCHVNELPIPLVCQKRVERALRAHQALKKTLFLIHSGSV